MGRQKPQAWLSRASGSLRVSACLLPTLDLLPIGAEEVAGCEPILETMSGWQESTVGATSHDVLPPAARAYLARIETLCEIPIDIISTGPERDETILRRHPFD